MPCIIRIAIVYLYISMHTNREKENRLRKGGGSLRRRKIVQYFRTGLCGAKGGGYEMRQCQSKVRPFVKKFFRRLSFRKSKEKTRAHAKKG